jgi:osmotically-inducible protein OsmY
MTMTMTATDQGLIDDVLARMERDPLIDLSRIDIEVEEGVVTLAGAVPWTYQKAAAQRAAGATPGVRTVRNRLTIDPVVSTRAVQSRIASALSPYARGTANGIRVDVAGRRVVLSGFVASWVDKNEAERAAWRAPGVAEVRNNLVIV